MWLPYCPSCCTKRLFVPTRLLLGSAVHSCMARGHGEEEEEEMHLSKEGFYGIRIWGSSCSTHGHKLGCIVLRCGLNSLEL